MGYKVTIQLDTELYVDVVVYMMHVYTCMCAVCPLMMLIDIMLMMLIGIML